MCTMSLYKRQIAREEGRRKGFLDSHLAPALSFWMNAVDRQEGHKAGHQETRGEIIQESICRQIVCYSE